MNIYCKKSKYFYSIINESIESLGYRIVQTELSLESKKLSIMIEKTNGVPINIEDCSYVNQYISTLLYVENNIKNQYAIEVSSPGIERPLNRLEDFQNFYNRKAKITLYNKFNGKDKYIGILVNVKDSNVIMELTESPQIITIDFNNIKKANLVFTEEEFRKSIK